MIQYIYFSYLYHLIVDHVLPFFTAQSFLQLLNLLLQQGESSRGSALPLHVGHAGLQLLHLQRDGHGEVKQNKKPLMDSEGGDMGAPVAPARSCPSPGRVSPSAPASAPTEAGPPEGEQKTAQTSSTLPAPLMGGKNVTASHLISASIYAIVQELRAAFLLVQLDLQSFHFVLVTQMTLFPGSPEAGTHPSTNFQS